MANNPHSKIESTLWGGVAPAITTGFYYSIMEVYEQQETGETSPD